MILSKGYEGYLLILFKTALDDSSQRDSTKLQCNPTLIFRYRHHLPFHSSHFPLLKQTTLACFLNPPIIEEILFYNESAVSRPARKSCTAWPPLQKKSLNKHLRMYLSISHGIVAKLHVTLTTLTWQLELS